MIFADFCGLTSDAIFSVICGDPEPIVPCYLRWQAAFNSPGQLFKNWVYPPYFRRFLGKTTHFSGQLDQNMGLPP